jgi:hypothetical protein
MIPKRSEPQELAEHGSLFRRVLSAHSPANLSNWTGATLAINSFHRTMIPGLRRPRPGSPGSAGAARHGKVELGEKAA